MKTTDTELIDVVSSFIQRCATFGEAFKPACWAMLLNEGALEVMDYAEFETMWTKAMNNLTIKKW